MIDATNFANQGLNIVSAYSDGNLASVELHERRDVIPRWEEHLEDRRHQARVGALLGRRSRS